MTELPEPQSHLAPTLLSRLLLKALSDEELRSAHEHAARCAACRSELDEALRASRRFEQSVFPRTRAAVEARAARRWAWPRLAPALGLGLGLATALALLVLPARQPAFQEKGTGALTVYGRRGDRVFSVESGARLRPGDGVRFGVQTGFGYVAIASIDARGQVSVYLQSTALARDVRSVQLLPDSIVLDDAIGPERIFAFFSDSPVSCDEVTRALAALGASGVEAIRRESRLPLPLAQASVLIEKRAEP